MNFQVTFFQMISLLLHIFTLLIFTTEALEWVKTRYTKNSIYPQCICTPQITNFFCVKSKS
jgi:hypothetical protein